MQGPPTSPSPWPNHAVDLPTGTWVATAYAVPDDAVLGDASIQTLHWDRSRPAVRSCHFATELPPHMLDLWEDSKLELGTSEREALRQLLLRYQDVFAASDFDLGDFTAVSHSIDTADAAPIKQRMRRTPLHFKSEEDGPLDKMLSAGVIQPPCQNGHRRQSWYASEMDQCDGVWIAGPSTTSLERMSFPCLALKSVWTRWMGTCGSPSSLLIQHIGKIGWMMSLVLRQLSVLDVDSLSSSVCPLASVMRLPHSLE
ncbi:treslin-like isoform x1 [Plakobranchus ocellatus]|uniref:Treslin-like isoform x1 n=1 Tax=Plakobranchus ocellatus TaxID=259542 RepID=A0AAV4B1F1_9GAST|nr:treslin-like isoform x1 [Plakobranchus ocellatus]